jgi:hypothetical protein
MLEMLDANVERLGEQYESERFAELRLNGWDTDEAEMALAHQDASDMRELVLPRFVWGPYAVSLSACLESGVTTVAEALAGKAGSTESFHREKGESFLSAAARYYDEVLRLPLETNGRRYRRLTNLYLVRNAVAHANGIRDRLSTSQWDKLLAILSEDGGAGASLRRGALVLTSDYVRTAYADVNATLRSLMDRAKNIAESIRRPEDRSGRRRGDPW